MTLRQMTVMMLITMSTWYNGTQTGDSDDVDCYVHIMMTPRQVTVMMLIIMSTWYNDTQTDDSDDVDYYVHRV